jgi:hypothetical protein
MIEAALCAVVVTACCMSAVDPVLAVVWSLSVLLLLHLVSDYGEDQPNSEVTQDRPRKVGEGIAD